MRFANPQFLYLIPIVLLIVIIFYIYERRKQAALLRAFGSDIGPYLLRTLSVRKRKWKIRLEAIVVCLLLLALARPQLGIGEQQVKSKGIELVVAVDISKSMLAEDVKPSRLDHVKRELNRLLDQLSGDKVGLIVFAGNASLVSPLTSDYSSLKMFIDGLSTDSVSRQGTNFKNAIQTAFEAFQRGGVESNESTVVSKVLLIASDGEDNEDGAIEEARRVFSKGMRIYTMGFGTERGGSIPLRERGYLQGYKKDNRGEVIVTKTQTKLLKDIATNAGGKFYFAVIGGQQVVEFGNEIKDLDQAEFESAIAKDFNEYFQIPLLFAFLIGFLEFLLSDRKKEVKEWRGRFEVSDA
ncbi:MAG: VWA domain-containing protein [Bdellovibrionales bacterium]